MTSTSSRTILVFTANRAERGLLEPVIRAIEAHGLTVSLQDMSHLHTSFGDVYVSTVGRVTYNRPDLALVPCDRQEMVFVALALFYNNIPFAHFHAGDVGSGVHDEVFRWMISRMATLHFCNSPESAYNLVKSGEEPWRIHLVGSTAFDGVEIDESTLPPPQSLNFAVCEYGASHASFNLILVHPDTFSEIQTKHDVYEASGFLNDGFCVVLGPNHDSNWQIVDSEWKQLQKSGRYLFEYHPDGLPRPQFLALMKHCKRFITNSSSALYELPAFDISKWVNVGKRNAERKPLTTIQPGASKQIAEFLATVELNERLLRKKFTL